MRTGGDQLALLPNIISALGALSMLAAAIAISRFGLEFTDESFYILWMSAPWEYSVSGSQFGYVYHAPFMLLGRSISAIRIANYLTFFVLAWLLSWVLLEQTLGPTHARCKLRTALVALPPSATILLALSFELPQLPSYNSLSIQALLLGALGLALLSRKGAWDVPGASLVGIATCLLVLAKPTSAGGFVLVALGFGILSGTLSKKVVGVAALVGAGALLFAVLAIDGSVSAFVDRLEKHIEVTRLLTGGDKFMPDMGWLVPAFLGYQRNLLLAFVGLSIMLFLCDLSYSKRMRVVAPVVSAASGILTLCIVWNAWSPGTPFERYSGLILVAIPIGGVIAVALAQAHTPLPRKALGLVLALFALPHVYAFGTGRPLYLNAQGASYFWIIGGTVLLVAWAPEALKLRVAALLGSVSMLGAAVFFTASTNYPMRLTERLWNSTEQVVIGGSDLYVSSDFAAYIRGLQRAAREGGFVGGTPLIDMTGHSPGAAVVIGATAPGTPWLLGGYPGSNKYISAIMNRITCAKLARAWLLQEPGGKEAAPNALLIEHGIVVERDYELVGSAQATKALYTVNYRQELLRPRRAPEAAEAACTIHRAQQRTRG